MKIYFCGSIRGGRENAALYHRMIEFLKGYGPVLTEHVGDPNLPEKVVFYKLRGDKYIRILESAELTQTVDIGEMFK